MSPISRVRHPLEQQDEPDDVDPDPGGVGEKVEDVEGEVVGRDTGHCHGGAARHTGRSECRHPPDLVGQPAEHQRADKEAGQAGRVGYQPLD